MLGRTEARPAKPITLRHLLTHPAGFCYELWDTDGLLRQGDGHAVDPNRKARVDPHAARFRSKQRWGYGFNTDRVGRVVEGSVVSRSMAISATTSSARSL